MITEFWPQISKMLLWFLLKHSNFFTSNHIKSKLAVNSVACNPNTFEFLVGVAGKDLEFSRPWPWNPLKSVSSESFEGIFFFFLRILPNHRGRVKLLMILCNLTRFFLFHCTSFTQFYLWLFHNFMNFWHLSARLFKKILQVIFHCCLDIIYQKAKKFS